MRNNSLQTTHSKQNKNIVITIMAVAIAALLFLCMRGLGKKPVDDPSQIDGTSDVQTGTIDIVTAEDGRDLQAEVNFMSGLFSCSSSNFESLDF